MRGGAAVWFWLLNLMSFLFHGIQDIADADYVGSGASLKARASFGRRDAFFWALRYEMSRYLHENWRHLLLTIAGGTRWLNSELLRPHTSASRAGVARAFSSHITIPP
jgi:hypothetical protein